MPSVFFKNVRPWAWFCCTALLFFAIEPAQVSATAAAQAAVRETFAASLEAMWTGQTFGPDLVRQQQEMKRLLDQGVITKAELTAIMDQTIPVLMNRHTTSRYYLQEISGRIEALFASHLTWEEIKQRIWQEMAAIVKDGDQMVFKVGTLAPKGTPWLNVPETMLIPRMEALSNGKITLKLYGGGVMGEDIDILRKIDIGQLDVCGATTLGMLAASPETAVFMLPGLFNNHDEVDYIYKKFRKRLDAGFEEKGYILAALIDTGYFHIYSKNRVNSLADLRKQKVITCWGTVESTVFNELGISAIPVAVPEAISALSTGLGDTALAPSAWMLGMQAYQYTGYYITPPLLFSPAVVIMGVRAVERIQQHFGVSDIFTRNIQEVIVFEVGLFEQAWRDQIRTYESRALHAFETKVGMKTVTFPAADQEALRQAGLRARKKLAGAIFPEDLMNEVLAALESYRENQGSGQETPSGI